MKGCKVRAVLVGWSIQMIKVKKIVLFKFFPSIPYFYSELHLPCNWDLIYFIKLLDIIFVNQIFQYVRRHFYHS